MSDGFPNIEQDPIQVEKQNVLLSEREYFLHPIIVAPSGLNVHKALQIATKAGYSKLVVEPLNGWTPNDIQQIPINKVGAIEDSWHPNTTSNVFQKESWLRLIGQETDQYPLPWDNYFWGDASEVEVKRRVINARFTNAIMSGHAPINEEGWKGVYAWEINPDHNVQGPDVFNTPGYLSVDLLHLTRLSRNAPHHQMTTEDDLLAYLGRLVKERGDDIKLIHLHLSVKEIIPFALGKVPQRLQDAFQILRNAGDGKVPIAVQYLPPAFINFSFLAPILPRAIRINAERYLFKTNQYTQNQQMNYTRLPQAV